MATIIKGNQKRGRGCKRGEWHGTFSEILAEAEAAPRSRRWAEDMGKSFCEDNAAETLRKAKEGYPEAVEKIVKMQDTLFRNAERPSPTEYHRDVVGYFFDVADVLQGIPEAWFDPDSERVQREEIVIHVNGSMHCGVPQDRIIRRGAVLAEVIDSLMLNGPVKVVWHNTTDIYHTTVQLSFEKGVYSKNVLAFMIAHPGMLRRLSFCSADTACGYPFTTHNNYGSPQSIGIKSKGNVIVFDHHAEGDNSLHNYDSDDAARKTAEKVLEMVRKAEAALLGEEA